MNIAIIPARGGSVRIPRKNIKLFHGKPIICYPIETARLSNLFDAVVVSTDDDEIARIAAIAGAQVFRRQPDDGKRGTQEVAQEVLLAMPQVRVACVIYATSPLLSEHDLLRGQRALIGHQYAMSVQIEPLADAGCFYWGQAEAFRRGLPLIDTHTAMVPMQHVCDINTIYDWHRAESMFTALRRAN